jgi:hypothetical protein
LEQAALAFLFGGALWPLSKQPILPELGVKIEGEKGGTYQLFQLVSPP